MADKPEKTPEQIQQEQALAQENQVIAIKEELIKELKGQIVDLKNKNAVLETNNTRLEIDLSSAKAVIDAKSIPTSESPMEVEYLTTDEANRQMLEASLRMPYKRG